jgi:hypothetical protein
MRTNADIFNVEVMEHAPRPGVKRIERLALLIGAVLVSVNIWTGAPLFAVWVGSRAAPAGGSSMGAIAIVIGVLAVLVFALAAALTRLNAAYDRLTGRDAGSRHVTAWLRPMGSQRDQRAERRVKVSPVERVVILSVVLAVLTFEVWFFFFARYSIPGA